VVLLPANGFVVIAFRADNPGAWLLHCHIAWHASSGLALQILERQEATDRIFTPEKLRRVNQGCRKWRDWFGEEKNFWNPKGGVQAFQDDSGI
jgi:Multicopper oxidase